MERVGDLDVDQDLKFYQRARVIETWAPWVLLLLVIAALLGLFGYGWLGRDTVTAGPVEVEYDRLAQTDSLSVIEVQVADPSQTVELWIDASALSQVRIEQVQPPAESVRQDGERVVYRFPASGDRMTVTFHMQYPSPGSRRMQLGVSGGPALELPQFIYP